MRSLLLAMALPGKVLQRLLGVVQEEAPAPAGRRWDVTSSQEGQVLLEVVGDRSDQEVALVPGVHSEALRLCRVRSGLACDAKALRDLVDRTVPWDIVTAWWERLSVSPVVFSRELTLPEDRGESRRARRGCLAYAHPSLKLKQLVD